MPQVCKCYAMIITIIIHIGKLPILLLRLSKESSFLFSFLFNVTVHVLAVTLLLLVNST